jgi:hypothetical protein
MSLLGAAMMDKGKEGEPAEEASPGFQVIINGHLDQSPSWTCHKKYNSGYLL